MYEGKQEDLDKRSKPRLSKSCLYHPKSGKFFDDRYFKVGDLGYNLAEVQSQNGITDILRYPEQPFGNLTEHKYSYSVYEGKKSIDLHFYVRTARNTSCSKDLTASIQMLAQNERVNNGTSINDYLSGVRGVNVFYYVAFGLIPFCCVCGIVNRLGLKLAIIPVALMVGSSLRAGMIR